ncbi:MAG: metal-dependent hydrolase [Anaerolineae bacterium]|nr:metal-dependent hydrolase [Anaerolineae bacterium]
MLFGHLAVSALEHRYVRAAFVPVMAAAVFPDILDKTAHYALGLTDSGRMWAHTLLAALITSGVVLVLWGKRAATSWALGYLSHLVCDINNVVPWLYPLVTYEFPMSEGFRATLWASLTDTPRMLLETSLSVWALVAHRADLRSLTLKFAPAISGRRLRPCRDRPGTHTPSRRQQTHTLD